MRDEDVTRITRSAANAQRHALMDTLRRAQTEGELDAQTNIESLADFFEATLAGIRIAAKAGRLGQPQDESLRLRPARCRY
jgi:TetR/AcrR family transcriptional regulator, transcriptional repressor for nem operon